ncbi:MAG TPA: radical SAM family heme chaperone HemW [Bacteroides sp.]|nr:radical SAM family heme chaperone HemW [Bacteroides sp.]
MAGVYIHIPFCKQACRYCDFFFTVSAGFKKQFVDCLIGEIRMRAGEFKGRPADTLYLGGGTPSLLTEEELDRILKELHRHIAIREDAEQTIECNPDDMDRAFLERIRKRGFNRISIGVQSFREEDLQLMRRSHAAVRGEEAVNEAAGAGFKNITIDLIYGLPRQSLLLWEENLSRALSLPISHLSAYHLTYEPGTVFDHWRKKGRLIPLQDEESEQMFLLLREKLEQHGFDHYEISNFARDGKMSVHNLIYWTGKPYVGFGPSAHSFDGATRSWNVSSMKKYIEGIAGGMTVRGEELLQPEQQYHDYLITSLRTKWGTDPEYILEQFGRDRHDFFVKGAEKFLREGTMVIRDGKVAIRRDRWLIADYILRALFILNQE